MWINPIFDRTAADVASGADKCFFSAELLNRIEGNTAHLAEILQVVVATKHWVPTDFLTPSEMQRILDNVAACRDAYYALPGTAPLPGLPATDWASVNAIEQMQWGILELWTRNRKNKLYAGEGFAGQRIGVI